MLTQSLKMLTRDGLVARFVEPTAPPRVSYELTQMGEEAAATLNEVLRWIGRRVPDIRIARMAYDAEKTAR